MQTSPKLVTKQADNRNISGYIISPVGSGFLDMRIIMYIAVYILIHIVYISHDFW